MPLLYPLFILGKAQQNTVNQLESPGAQSGRLLGRRKADVRTVAQARDSYTSRHAQGYAHGSKQRVRAGIVQPVLARVLACLLPHGDKVGLLRGHEATPSDTGRMTIKRIKMDENKTV